MNHPQQTHTQLSNQTYHCTASQCRAPISLQYTNQRPSFCPFCGSPDPITDQDYTLQAFLNSPAISRPTLNGARITQEMLDMVYTAFRSQNAFQSFNEYIGCMLYGDTPTATQKAL